MTPYDISVDTQSLYLHWPFCPYKCHFCPFVALASHDQFMEQYHEALKAEIAQFVKQCPQPLSIKTIYIGGGTPSTYPDALLLDMAGILKRSFITRDSTEMTIEVNPGTVRAEQLPLWAELGINRLSIGVQALNDQVLYALNRFQKASDVYRLLSQASRHFKNLSIDLILGLPGISPAAWKKTIRKAVEWPIKHISMYFLTVHEETPLYFKVESGQVALPDDEEIIELYEWTRDFFAEHGFAQYELSNFARPGYESQHNSAYWDRVPYKAFGLGACSFDGRIRFQNEKNLMRYMKQAMAGESVISFQEELTPEEVRLERLMLGLRRKCGVKREAATQGLSSTQRDQFDRELALLKRRRVVTEKEGVLRLTPPGVLIENEVVARLSH